ncbi:MAG TPA: glycosyltransferase family 39 protein [Candidatus Krumholzibacteriaceae bacterium]|nr:glycosyltransferase family 39 protein [Candidatus Krumholzibacteriaceae bacterium]
MIELPFLTGEHGRGPFLVILFFISISVITLWGIWLGSLPANEEAVNAEMAKEVLETGDLRVMHFDSEPVYDVPPLPAVFASAFIKVLGTTEIAARLPFVLFSIAILYLIFIAGGAERGESSNSAEWITGRHALGLLSAVILAANPVFARYSPHINFNIPFAMFTTLSLTGWLLLPRKRSKGLLLWGLGIAGGMLSAGTAGIFPVAAGAAAASFDSERRGVLKSLNFWLTTAFFTAIGSTWVLPAILKSGSMVSFDFPVWFGFGDFAGFSNILDRLPEQGGKLWLGFLPWSIPAAAAAVRILFVHKKKSKYRGVSGTDLSLFVFAVVLFVFIVPVKPAQPGAFLPLIPVLSILSAREMARWLRSLERLWSFNQIMVGILCFLMLLLFITPLSFHRRETDSIEIISEAKEKLMEKNRPVYSYRLDINRYQKAIFLFYGGWSPEGKYANTREILRIAREDSGAVFVSSPERLHDFDETEVRGKINIIYPAREMVLFSLPSAREMMLE